VAKDRAAPFSRKHRRYWLPVTGGMLLIGAINIVLGYAIWPGEDPPSQPIIPVFKAPPVDAAPRDAAPGDSAAPTLPDAGVAPAR
jgi:hypothetical protein